MHRSVSVLALFDDFRRTVARHPIPNSIRHSPRRPGTDVTLGGTGLFKQTQLNKQVQMTPARPAAGMDRGAASVPGGGTAL